MTADMTPPPVKPDPETVSDAAPSPADAGVGAEPVGSGLLRPGEIPGAESQQAENLVVAMVRQPGVRELFDAVTGEAPDPATMFARVGFSGTVYESRIRLMERMWVNTASTVERLVMPAGRQVSAGAALQIMEKVRAQRQQETGG